MQNQQSIKRIKMAVISLLAALGCLHLPSMKAGAGAAQEQGRGRFEVVGQDTPPAERFGADDGAAFILHFTGDIHGSLQPCG